MSEKSDNLMFDFEQSIMNCWSVVDDLKILTERVLDGPRPMTEDEISNVLIGLENLYQLKFEKLFSQFEQVSKEYWKKQ